MFEANTKIGITFNPCISLMSHRKSRNFPFSLLCREITPLVNGKYTSKNAFFPFIFKALNCHFQSECTIDCRLCLAQQTKNTMRSEFLLCTMHSRNRNSNEGMGFIVSTQLRLTREEKNNKTRGKRTRHHRQQIKNSLFFDAGTQM